jgi:hypothetical protein
MPRPKHTVPSVPKNIALPQPLVDRLDLELHSEVEGRVPQGAYKAFFTRLIELYFAQNVRPCPHCSGTGVKGGTR